MPVTLVHKPKGPPAERVLIIGGFQPNFYAALRQTPWYVEEIFDGQEALSNAARLEYGVVVCSLRMNNAWGLDVLDAILKADPLTPVIMSTHEQSPRIIVDAMQRGAFDYVIEPFADIAYVIEVIGRATRRRAALRQGQVIRNELQSPDQSFLSELIGRSAPLRELCERIRRVSSAGSPVLIEGESGSGKELVARAIHKGSARKGPFIAIHCGAIPESLLESELFGHEKGAFTGADSMRAGVFEAAHYGTLFLDEIGLTSASCQAKLLRALESGSIRRVGSNRELPVNVRIVSATNEPLDGLVASGRFRQDLFFRLNVVGLRVPPLRDRQDDIPLLCHHFAERFAREAGKPFQAFSQAALEALQKYEFPGNIRELRNIVERAVVFARDPVIGTAELPESIRANAAPDSTHASDTLMRDAYLSLNANTLGLNERLAAVEKSMIDHALVLSKGNRSRAAKLLKIKRTTLLQKLIRRDDSKRIRKKAAPKGNSRSPKRKK